MCQILKITYTYAFLIADLRCAWVALRSWSGKHRKGNVGGRQHTLRHAPHMSCSNTKTRQNYHLRLTGPGSPKSFSTCVIYPKL